MKLYVDISNGGEHLRLQKSGVADMEKCLEVWESIIRQNGESHQSFAYSNYLQTHKSYATLISTHLTVKAMLLKAFIVEDEEDLAYLKSKGYKINKSGTRAEYVQSLYDAVERSNNMTTRITMKQNELKKYGEENGGTKAVSFQFMMANLNLALGMVESDDILLSKYNEYQRILKAKEALKK